MDIVICTTAVTRPDLHTKVFPGYLKFIGDLNVQWYLNIDQLPNSPFVSETIDNLKPLFINSPNIKLHLTSNNKGGDRSTFFYSAQKLINKVSSLSPKYGVLWLEDDWEYTGKYLLKDILPQNFDKCEYVQLVSRNKEVSFNPGIINPTLFKYFISNINNINHGHYGTNPERTCVSPKEKMDLLVKSHHYIKPCFVDAGREWQKNKKIFRTFDISKKI
jgi:hypothetical protein